MPRLVPLKPQEVVRKLKNLGFEGPFPGGRHRRMVDFKTGRVAPVPFHKGQDVSVGLNGASLDEMRPRRIIGVWQTARSTWSMAAVPVCRFRSGRERLMVREQD